MNIFCRWFGHQTETVTFDGQTGWLCVRCWTTHTPSPPQSRRHVAPQFDVHFMKEIKMAIQLGDKVRDTVTDFEGTVIQITEYLNGCRRCAVQGKVGADGKLPDAHYFDEPQLEVLKARSVPSGSSRDRGGPLPPVIDRRDPGPR